MTAPPPLPSRLLARLQRLAGEQVYPHLPGESPGGWRPLATLLGDQVDGTELSADGRVRHDGALLDAGPTGVLLSHALHAVARSHGDASPEIHDVLGQVAAAYGGGPPARTVPRIFDDGGAVLRGWEAQAGTDPRLSPVGRLRLRQALSFLARAGDGQRQLTDPALLDRVAAFRRGDPLTEREGVAR